MNNQEILQKAIEKAVGNGYIFPDIFPGKDYENLKIFKILNDVEDEKSLLELWLESGNWPRVIFSHDFAKAFWGEIDRVGTGGEWTCPVCAEEDVNTESWQYHLVKMVISKDPIKYLEQFI